MSKQWSIVRTSKTGTRDKTQRNESPRKWSYIQCSTSKAWFAKTRRYATNGIWQQSLKRKWRYRTMITKKTRYELIVSTGSTKWSKRFNGKADGNETRAPNAILVRRLQLASDNGNQHSDDSHFSWRLPFLWKAHTFVSFRFSVGIRFIRIDTPSLSIRRFKRRFWKKFCSNDFSHHSLFSPMENSNVCTWTDRQLDRVRGIPLEQSAAAATRAVQFVWLFRQVETLHLLRCQWVVWFCSRTVRACE